jgi:transposase
VGRYELTDVQWARLKPLLPPEKPRPGRPNHDHRRILNGILWIDRTGAPWNDLPSRHGPVGTVSSRFHRWRKAGIWQRILQALQACADCQGRVDWSLHFVDSTIVRAHQHAAGARKPAAKRGIHDEALGRSRGGFTTKIHLRAEGLGKPVTFSLTGGRVHDSQQVATLMNTGWIRRRQGLQQPGDPGVAAQARHRRRDPDQEQRAAGPRLRPRGPPSAQPDRAADQPVETVPPGRDTIRKARRQLSRHDTPRCHSSMALRFAEAP